MDFLGITIETLVVDNVRLEYKTFRNSLNFFGILMVAYLPFLSSFK